MSIVLDFVTKYYYIFGAILILFICIIIDVVVDTKSKDKKEDGKLDKSSEFKKYDITEVDVKTLKEKKKKNDEDNNPTKSF